ncbi:MAG: glutaredoxin family protein [Geodermatophilaceae bacterium]|jgi:glutaredoxin|nr:glutaredoxin family protein [Geodermatophilaceae bacterium]
MLKPDDRVVVYMRPGCHVCARVKKFLTEHDVPYEARDVDGDPLTPRELWDLFNRKADRLRVPFTALNDGEDVVLGFDPQRLEGVFVHGELGGVQVATAVTGVSGYDEFTTAELDGTRWVAREREGSDAQPTGRGQDIETGAGYLRISKPEHDVGYLSTQRFATPPGSLVSFQVDMSFEAGLQPAPLLGPPLGEVGLRDLPTGMLLGFEVTNEAIVAVHRRTGVAGVAAESEHFAHRVFTDLDSKAGQSHRYRISYRHDTSQARWYVDDRSVYDAIAPLQIEGVSLSMGLVLGDGTDTVDASRQSAVATWTPWQVVTT